MEFYENDGRNITVIIINGSGGVGKSTFCTFCNTALKSLDAGEELEELSSVAWPKEVAKYCGWDGVSKTEKDRKFLSDLKVALEDWDNSPIKKVHEQMAKHFDTLGIKYYMVNIREPWRVDDFKKECLAKGYHVKTLLITNPRIKAITSNIGDASVANYDYDYVLENNGDIHSFEQQAYNFMKVILAIN